MLATFLVLALAITSEANGAYIFEHIGANNPTSEGWIAASTGTQTVTTGPVTNDGGSGIDSWGMDDNATNGQLYYAALPTLAESTYARAHGWRLSAELRFIPDSFGSESSVATVSFFDGSVEAKLWSMFFRSDGNGNLTASVLVDPKPSSPTKVVPGSILDYHLFELVFNGTSGTAQFFIDGVRAFEDVTLAGHLGLPAGIPYVAFGIPDPLSNTAEARFSHVRFEIVPEASSMVLAGLGSLGIGLYQVRRKRRSSAVV
ncbi:MAG: hypothetical protein U1D30_01455 [Planctomycetota bacterium]